MMARQTRSSVTYKHLYDLDNSVDKHNEAFIFLWKYKMVIRLNLTKMGIRFLYKIFRTQFTYQYMFSVVNKNLP